MPQMELTGATQDFTYWEYLKKDRYGIAICKSPIDVKGRLEESLKRSPNPQLNTEGVSHLLKPLDRDLLPGSIIWVGKKDDYPNDDLNLFEVIEMVSTPDIKGRHFRKEAVLTKYRERLPTINS